MARAREALPRIGPSPTLRDRIRGWHARLAGNARFRDWAAGFPLTRPIARRNAARLFDLCAGFVYSQILATCLRLDLVGVLRDGALPADVVAARIGLAPDAARTLLEATSALGLTATTADGGYAVGPLGAALIDNPGVAAMVAHHALLYDDLRDPVALLQAGRGEALSGFWSYAGSAASTAGAATGAAPASAYSGLMSASLPMVAQEVASAYRFARHRRILDVGGGEGRFLATVAAAAPQAALALFDLPPVAALARARFAAAGLADRAEAIAGDFRAGPLPAGADLVTLVRVLHDHDDAVVAALLRSIRAALAPGGRILIAEPMAGTPGAEAMGAAYFGFYLLAMGQGRPRRAAELATMLRDAGFAQPRLLPTRLPVIVSVMTADVAPG